MSDDIDHTAVPDVDTTARARAFFSLQAHQLAEARRLAACRVEPSEQHFFNQDYQMILRCISTVHC